jgi:phage terminase small subunit
MAKGNKTGGRRKGVRNKATQEISELAKALVPESLKELGRLAKEAQSETARVSAIGMILDRAYGKPSQAIQHSGSVGTYDLTKVTDEDLDRLEAILGPIALVGGDQGGEGEAGGE